MNIYSEVGRRNYVGIFIRFYFTVNLLPMRSKVFIKNILGTKIGLRNVFKYGL